MSINVAFFCTGNGSFLKFIEQNRDTLGKFAWGGGVNLYLLCDRECGAYVDLKDKIDSIILQYSELGGVEFERQATCWLESKNVDYLVLTCDRILRYSLLDSYCKNKKAFNIHPALLPNYIGMRAVERSFVSDDSIYGATIHYVTKELDMGPRVARCVVERDSDNFVQYAHKLFVNQSVLLLNFLCVLVSRDQIHLLDDTFHKGFNPSLVIEKQDIVFFDSKDKEYLEI
ncbi:hypothetical protein C826_01302 [Helicobacter bilis WiWa]|uniref:phosphoribosylglycinamide formyltransferase 1 n=1 Tax=Helicobacter bilis WiWa TaxID=1235804 RepID=N2BPQ0_9HELI|nr:formyltransferase family protein [Helicobacter bilis]EMZ38879.1 hypothetical protein C826_01302 [Helicobacter bilis WiWa]TLE03870.1 hypothetical protein LS76_009485 [Helicobacter bilis]